MKLLFCFFLVFIIFHQTNAAQTNLIKKVNEFSTKLFVNLINERKTRVSNIILSPVLIQNALVALTNGASERALKNIDDGMHYNESQSEITNYFQTLMKNLESDKNVYMSNTMFIDSDYQINSTYQEKVKKFFFTDVKNEDFSNKQNASNSINHFISEETKQTLGGLIIRGTITDYTKFILANAINYVGPFNKTFSPWFTSKHVFPVPKLVPSNTKQSELMVKTKFTKGHLMNNLGKYRVGYFRKLGVSVLELPYADNNYKLLIMLPTTKFGIFKLEQLIQYIDISKMSDHLETRLVNVSIPKYQIDLNVDVAPILEKMGIALQKEGSNSYSRIAVPKGKTAPLEVTNLIQKTQIAFIQGQTFSEGYWYERPANPPGTPEFICNHPFLFILMRLDTVIQIGRIVHI